MLCLKINGKAFDDLSETKPFLEISSQFFDSAGIFGHLSVVRNLLSWRLEDLVWLLNFKH